MDLLGNMAEVGVVVVGAFLFFKPVGDLIQAKMKPKMMEAKIEEIKKAAEIAKAEMDLEHLQKTYPETLQRGTHVQGLIQEQQVVAQQHALQKAQAALPSGAPLADAEEAYAKECLRMFGLTQYDYKEWAKSQQVPSVRVWDRGILAKYLSEQHGIKSVQ